RGAKMIVEGEVGRFVDAHTAGADAAVGERSSRDLRGTFVFLPDENLGRELQALAHAAFLKGRNNNYGISAARNDQRQKTLAGPPANAREVVEPGAWSEKHSVEFRLRLIHDSLRLFNALAKLFGGNGANPRAEGLQSVKGAWQGVGSVAAGLQARSDGGRGDERARLQKATPRGTEGGQASFHGEEVYPLRSTAVKLADSDTYPLAASLLHANGEDVLALHLYLEAEGRSQIRTLGDQTADPHIAGQVGHARRVEKRPVARISDHRVFRIAESVVGFQLSEIGNIFQPAIAVGGGHRQTPI